MNIVATVRDRVLYLAGEIDEEFDASLAFQEAEKDELLLDLSGIRSVNSMGVVQWIPALAGLSATRQVSITRVAYTLVLNANCVKGFFGGAEVLSVMSPYYCGTCDVNELAEISYEQLLASDWKPPEVQCPTCKGAFDFDELENYFAFMKRTPE